MFALEIPVTTEAMQLLKAELRKALPNVKSSHRVEGAARALGYRTYAALLAATRSTVPAVRKVDGHEFSSYLGTHGFEFDSVHLYRSIAGVAIRLVLAKVPRLSMRGLGISQPQRNPDGTWETPQQQYQDFLSARREFLEEHAKIEFLLSIALVCRIPATSTIRPGTGSYRLKHIAENYSCTYPEGQALGPTYVSNGSLIAAAVHKGFSFKGFLDSRGYDSVNVCFNMSKRAVDDLDCEIRPRSACAEDRAARQWARSRTQLWQPAIFKPA